MFIYIIRRLIAVVAMLFVISIATFLLFYAGPTDPARLTCAKNCTPGHGRGEPARPRPRQADRGAVLRLPQGPGQRAQLPGRPGTGARGPADDHPVRGAVPGLLVRADRPRSARSSLTACRVTVSLAVGAFVLWMVVGVSSGMIAALRRGAFVDRGIVGVALIGFSLPTFFIGLLLLNFVAIKWQLCPTRPTPRSSTTPPSGPVGLDPALDHPGRLVRRRATSG